MWWEPQGSYGCNDMFTVDSKTRPVWARLMILAATVVIAAALVVALAPETGATPEATMSGDLSGEH